MTLTMIAPLGTSGSIGLTGHTHHTSSGLAVLLMMYLFLTGCAEQPVPQLDAAIQALEEARMSGAEDYAIEIFSEAETVYLQAKQELDQQRDRMQVFRDYQPVTTMLTKVLNSATQAKTAAIANKQEAKMNAEVALALARKNLQDVRSLLSESSISATDHGDFDHLTLTIQSAEMLLAETEAIMTEENFIGVMTTAHAVESFATRIQEQIIFVRQLAAKRQV